jgi:hypothetical protein
VPDTRNGVKVERCDRTHAASALRELMGDALPEGVTFDQLTLYLARKGHWPVGIAVRLTAPCSVSRTVELSRPDDRRLEVKIPKSAAFS